GKHWNSCNVESCNLQRSRLQGLGEKSRNFCRCGAVTAFIGCSSPTTSQSPGNRTTSAQAPVALGARTGGEADAIHPASLSPAESLPDCRRGPATVVAPSCPGVRTGVEEAWSPTRCPPPPLDLPATFTTPTSAPNPCGTSCVVGRRPWVSSSPSSLPRPTSAS